MGVIKYITVAGSTIFVKVKQGRKKRTPGEKRQQREKATPEDIEKINQKNAERILAILINYNFKCGDLHIVLTYSGEEPSKEQAKKNLEKFKRDLAKLYREKELSLKWVTATEYENKRIHHHIVCSGGVDIIDIAKIWPHGFIRPTYLDKTGDYRKLASYLIKETSKTFRKTDAVSRRRYNCSRSIERPEPKKEAVSSSQLVEPKPVQGYYIDQDSIYCGKNPICGRPYIEYVMVSLTEEPRIKKWNRGKKTKLRSESYKINHNKQIELEVYEAI